MQEVLRALRQPRDPERACATVHEPGSVTVFPLEMSVPDVRSMEGRKLESAAELVALLRRFEAKAE